jgi:hypothetical protein
MTAPCFFLHDTRWTLALGECARHMLCYFRDIGWILKLCEFGVGMVVGGAQRKGMLFCHALKAMVGLMMVEPIGSWFSRRPNRSRSKSKSLPGCNFVSSTSWSTYAGISRSLDISDLIRARPLISPLRARPDRQGRMRVK